MLNCTQKQPVEGTFGYDFDLTCYDIIVVNTSAGKDSQVMLDVVYRLAKAQGVEDRVVAVHCDLGAAEWAGTKELAAEQCAHYGVRLYVVQREKGDLLHQVEFERMKWPAPKRARYCTSDQKRDQVTKLITRLVDRWTRSHYGRKAKPGDGVRVLNCIGLRAQESDERAAMPVLSRDERASSTVRVIDRWLPIHAWKLEDVWARIKETGVRHHFAYDLGMPRLSCAFCFYAPDAALLIAGFHNRAKLAEYVRIEKAINHQFIHGRPLIQIQAKLDAGYVPTGGVGMTEWADCGGGM